MQDPQGKTDHPPLRRAGRLAAAVLAAALSATVTALPVRAADRAPLPPTAAPLVERALGHADTSDYRDGRSLFEAVLASELFLSEEVGPFAIHVHVGPKRRDARDAKKLLAAAVQGLQPAAELVTRAWPAADDGAPGLVSGRRLPVVLVAGDREAHEQLVSLLDHCERRGYSGWHPANAVATPDHLAAEVVRTWEVQLFDLDHEVIADRRKAWLEHGLGYYALAFTVNRALRRGAWGLVPPWLAHGLIDELDIAAHGKAWVGQESWVQQTPGWFRPGWSGFVPQGMTPPPVVRGPPADLATTVEAGGDPWLSFDDSTSRHWTSLRADRDTEVPFSFARSAEQEAFLPRDRAAARCVLHLMRLSAEAGGTGLTALLDDEVATPRDGMPDSEPLPVLFARALGGVPEVDRLEGLSTAALLSELGRDDLARRLEEDGGAAALELSDHRAQSAWLARQRVDSHARQRLFTTILEVEYVQQLAEWRAIAPHLDHALAAVLADTKRYPRSERDLAPVVETFRQALSEDPAAAEQETKLAKGSRKTRKTSRRSRRRR